MAPGGRFNGDEYFWREYQAALERGTAGGNPDYNVPDWLTRLGGLGRLLAAHERNVQQGGAGQEPSLPGGYGYHGFSGPGAPYGPGGITPTRGLFDQGRPVDSIWDMPEMRPPGDSQPESGRRRGGGGGGGGNWSFAPYRGIGGSQQFVDWQPIGPTSPEEPTRFVPGRGGDPMPEPMAPAPGRRGGGGGGRGGAGGGSGGGRGGGRGGGSGQQPRPGGGGSIPPPGRDGMPTDPAAYFAEVARRLLGPNVGESARSSIHGGVDPNFLDFGTPGWRRDPTTGIVNTSGMPNPTPPAQDWGETEVQYRERLHDLGFTNDDIMAMTGPSSGWGTGGVVRGDNGYQFANQETPTGMTMNPLGRPGEGMFGGAGGGGGGQTGTGPSAGMEDFFNAANMGWMLR